MLKPKYVLSFLVFATIICICSCSNADNVPSFIKAKHRYLITNIRGNVVEVTVEEIDNSGWIKGKGKDYWMNLNTIMEILEVKPNK